MTSFSHNNLNIPAYEVWGNIYLNNLGITKTINITYDMYRPDVRNDDKIIIFGNKINLLPKKERKKRSLPIIYWKKISQINVKGTVNNLNVPLKEEEKSRLEELLSIYNKYAEGPLSITEKWVKIRKEIFAKIGIEVNEVPFSKLKEYYIKSLETLESLGMKLHELDLGDEGKAWPPKWKKEVSWLKYYDGENLTYLIYDGKAYVNGEVEIMPDEIYEKLKTFEILPSLPTIILTCIVGPGIPHLGGGSFGGYDILRNKEVPGYSKKLIYALANALKKQGLVEEPEKYKRLALSTGGDMIYKKSIYEEYINENFLNNISLLKIKEGR